MKDRANRSFVLHAARVWWEEQQMILVDKNLGKCVLPSKQKAFWHEYQKISYYLQYIRECELCERETLDWQFLHDQGMVCEWSYENIPEFKKLGLTHEGWWAEHGKPTFPEKPIICRDWEHYDAICARYLTATRLSPSGQRIYKYADVIKVCVPPGMSRHYE